MKMPINAETHPIEKLIAALQKLPPGTTYTEREGIFYGGQTITDDGSILGTAYQMNLEICNGIEEVAK